MTITSTLSLLRARVDAEALRDWTALEHFERGAFWVPVPELLPTLVEDLLAAVSSARRGRPPEPLARTIFARLRKEPIVPPLYRFWDPEARVYRFSAARRLRMGVWVRTRAPEEFRRLLVPAARPAGGA